MIKWECELEIQKVNELIEMKNKELVVFIFKFIEKDEFLFNFKDKLVQQNGDMSVRNVKQIVCFINSSNF